MTQRRRLLLPVEMVVQGRQPVPARLVAYFRYGDILPLRRLRYGGYANGWGFAIYRASHNDYQDSYLPTAVTARPSEEALDTACGLYLNDPTAWITQPPTN